MVNVAWQSKWFLAPVLLTSVVAISLGTSSCSSGGSSSPTALTESGVTNPGSSTTSLTSQGQVIAGVAQLSDPIQGYAAELRIDVGNHPHLPNTLTVGGATFLRMTTSFEPGWISYGSDLDSALMLLSGVDQFAIPSVDGVAVRAVDLVPNAGVSGSVDRTTLIYQGDINSVSVTDLALLLATIQDPTRTNASIVARANELLGATSDPVIPSSPPLDPLPDDNNTNYVDAGSGTLNTFDVAGILARIQEGEQGVETRIDYLTRLADRIDTLLGLTAGSTTAAEILTVPGELLPGQFDLNATIPTSTAANTVSIAVEDTTFSGTTANLGSVSYTNAGTLSGFTIFTTSDTADIGSQTAAFVPGLRNAGSTSTCVLVFNDGGDPSTLADQIRQSADCTATGVTITTNPAATTTVNSGDTVNLSVVATGTQPLSYQWYQGSAPLDGTDIAVGANSPSFTTPPITGDTSYFVVVSNQVDSLTSTDAVVTVTEPLTIINQPDSVAIDSGETTTLTVGVQGSAPFDYEWFTDVGQTGTFVSAQTTPGSVVTTNTLTTSALSQATDIRVDITNAAGSVSSNVVTVSITPTIATQPADTEVTGDVTLNGSGFTQPAALPADTATLSVTLATGDPSPTFQWYEGLSGDTSTPITGETAASFTTLNLATSANYWVQAIVSADGVTSTVDSDTATVSVLLPFDTALPSPTFAGDLAIVVENASFATPSFSIQGAQVDPAEFLLQSGTETFGSRTFRKYLVGGFDSALVNLSNVQEFAIDGVDVSSPSVTGTGCVIIYSPPTGDPTDPDNVLTQTPACP